MTFNKPPDITFTQMAQWVDKNCYNPSCDEQQLCEYIYHIVVLRTQQCGYFKDIEQVDDFAIYCTSKALSRIRSSKANPIKSICNYLNNVLSPWRADYLREFCIGYADVEIADFDVSDFGDYLIDIASEEDFDKYFFDCVKVSDVVAKYLKRIPQRKNSAEWLNIYTSCLLTLKNRIQYALDAPLSDKQSSKYIRSLKKLPPILYHLDDSMNSYISVLVNELIHALCAQLTKTFHSRVSVTACMKNLIMAASNDEEN